MRKSIIKLISIPFMLLCFSFSTFSEVNAADWTIQKMSGDVWIEQSGLKNVKLTKKTVLLNGNKIRTGPNGRVLLKRNKETILITPNSLIGLPKKPAEKGKTIILQQMGEILLDVEKRNVKHFEVSTPYLAAVVKGTKFSVSVDETGSKVDVLHGQVEVSDFKTGQFVLVKPGQAALVNAVSPNTSLKKGIILQGPGSKEKIKKRASQSPRVKPVKFKKKKNNKLQKVKNKKQNEDKSNNRLAKSTKNKKLKNKTKELKAKKVATKKLKNKKVRKLRKAKRKKRRMRIGRAIGHVKLNAHKSTKGLAKTIRYAALNRKKRNISNNKATYWSVVNGDRAKSISSSVTKNNKSVKKGNRSNNKNGRGNGRNSSASNATANNAAAVNSSSSSALSAISNGNGNGSGNAYGHSNGNNGNGNAYGSWWKNLIAAWKAYKNK
jgi:hypothetical protein